MPDFVHLHVHTEYSLLDGLSKIKKLVPLVKDMGMTALAITDHGNMYGAIEFYKTCLKNGIKPIIGTEAYFAPNGRFNKTPADRKVHHLILLAKNNQGYKNIMKLVSLGFLEGYYYKPRIDWEILEKYHEGIICTSACVEGEIPSLLLDGQYEPAKKKALAFQKLFGDDYYLEIQNHPGLDKSAKATELVVQLSRELGIPLVATNDSHYIKKEDAFAQDVLVMINTQTTINDKNRLSMYDIPDFYIKSPKQMADEFQEYPDAIANTAKIAAKVNIDIEIGNPHFPNFKIPAGETPESYLTKLTHEQAALHYENKIPAPAQERLDYELDVICSKGYATYFLIMRDFIEYANSDDVITNTRGSAAGSLTTYVLGITTVDPLIYELPFERFLNRDRPSFPDIDLDVADDKRQGFLHHIVEEYGLASVAQICTFGRMMARGAVRDTARVLGYEYAVGDKISKLIPLGKQGFPMSIDKALAITPELKQLYQTDPDSHKVIDTAKQIEDVARHISVHACGVVIAPDDATQFTPLQYESGGDKIITQYEFHAIDDVGLIKFDILGIRNLSILGAAVVNVRKTKGLNINFRKIDLFDADTFTMLAKGQTMGTFQLSGEGMTKWLTELKPTRIEDLMIMIALYRPGPMANIPEFINRKNGKSKVVYLHPKMEKFLQKSYGILVYQEDIMFTALELAGYTWATVDKLRKAIGKKLPEEMALQHEIFVEGCITSSGMTKIEAEKIWDLFVPFQGYGFNKAHAASYGMVAYYTAYMKAHYPVEFMCALLTAESGDTEKVSAGVEECRKMGIIVSPPDINKSVNGFGIEENQGSHQSMAIRFGFSGIKNVGNAAIDAILSERNTNGLFVSFSDFCLRTGGQKVNKKVLESLIKVGAFDQFGERNSIIKSIDEIRANCDRLSHKHNDGQFGLFDAPSQSPNARPIAPPDKLVATPAMTEKEKLGLEKELLGIYVSENPMNQMLAQFQTLSITKIVDCLLAKPQSTVKTAGVLTRVKEVVTKKSNSKMAFATLEDETGKIEMVIFPKIYQDFPNVFVQGQAIYLEGKINQRDGITSIAADLASLEPPPNTPRYDFVVQVPTGTSQQQLMALNSLLKNNPNGHRGLIILPNGKNIVLPYGVKYNPDLQSQIDQILKVS